MLRSTAILKTCTIVAAVAAASLALPSSASAAHRHHAHHMRMARLMPAHQRPGYVGYPAGRQPPMLIDVPTSPVGLIPTGMGAGGLLGNGGLLGVGVLPSTGLFTGVPILGGIGL